MRKEVDMSCYVDLHSRSGVPNSFSAVGHWILYWPNSIEKKVLADETVY